MGAGGTVLPGSLGAAAGGHGGARTRTSNQSKCSLSKCSLHHQKSEIRITDHRRTAHWIPPGDAGERGGRAGPGERGLRGRGGGGRGGGGGGGGGGGADWAGLRGRARAGW